MQRRFERPKTRAKLKGIWAGHNEWEDYLKETKPEKSISKIAHSFFLVIIVDEWKQKYKSETTYSQETTVK